MSSCWSEQSRFSLRATNPRRCRRRHASDVVDLVPDYAVSPAASIDAAGIGASLLPDALQLTVEQKAAIAALHDAFMKANARTLPRCRRSSRKQRQRSRPESLVTDLRAILAKAVPIRVRLDVAFRKLQADIWAVYTPEQRAWIESHRRAKLRPRHHCS